MESLIFYGQIKKVYLLVILYRGILKQINLIKIYNKILNYLFYIFLFLRKMEFIFYIWGEWNILFILSFILVFYKQYWEIYLQG